MWSPVCLWCVSPVCLDQMAPWRLPGGGPKGEVNGGSPRDAESEKTTPSRRGLRVARTSNGSASEREPRAGSLDYDEGVRLFRFGQSLTQGADPERRPRASGAVGEPDSVDRPGSDGS